MAKDNRMWAKACLGIISLAGDPAETQGPPSHPRRQGVSDTEQGWERHLVVLPWTQLIFLLTDSF